TLDSNDKKLELTSHRFEFTETAKEQPRKERKKDEKNVSDNRNSECKPGRCRDTGITEQRECAAGKGWCLWQGNRCRQGFIYCDAEWRNGHSKNTRVYKDPGTDPTAAG